MTVEALHLLQCWHTSQIRELRPELVRTSEVILMPDRTRWIFDPRSTDADDDATVLKPSDTTSGIPGRWRVWVPPSTGGGGGGGSDTGDVTLPINESDVSGLVSDLGTLASGISSEASARATADALLVPKSRVITTTAPLKIAGGASADLSADRTLSVDDATTGANGVVKLAGDLAGTASAPKVAAITETSGPTSLVIGSIADGFLAKRVGATLVGVDPATLGGGLSDQDKEDLLWDKKFFVDAGLLPSTKILDFSYDWTAPTVVSGTWSQDKGSLRGTSGGVAYYDLGAAFSTAVLIVISGHVPLVDHGFGLDDTVPTGSHGLATFDESNILWKNFSTPIGTTYGRLAFQYGLAFYWSPTQQYVFQRISGRWYKVNDAADTTFSAMRYWFFYCYAGASVFVAPAVAYAQ